MLIKNAVFLSPDGKFKKGNISFFGGKITGVGEVTSLRDETIDAKGNYVVPGYVDIHTHGCNGADFCDTDIGTIETLKTFLASEGVTSFLGTTMSYGEKRLSQIISESKSFMNIKSHGAVLRGINLEGPFICKSKKGAQNGKYIINPDIDMFRRLYDLSGGNIRIVDIAPDTDNAMQFIEQASKLCTVSLAHTNADYGTALKAFENGASHVTHLYNAMPAFTHREPSVVGASADMAKHVELICDGIHIHPSVVRATFEMFSEKRICLISDSMRACGLADGVYTLGGQDVTVNGAKATLSDGTIAGSVTSLAGCVRKAISFGIEPEKAIYSATMSPAEACGISDVTGSIEVGKDADIQILDKNFMPLEIFIAGKRFL